MLKTKLDIKEKLLTICIFTGIFLPVRLLFYSFVSQYWIGSFGLITGIMLSLIYFSNKGKLGKIGYIINKQVMSFSKGKLGNFVLFQTIFFLYFFGLAIYGIETAPEETKNQIVSVLAKEGIEDLEDISKPSNLQFEGGLGYLGVFFALIVLFTPSKLGASLYSIMNDFTNNWLLHFATVYFVESLEILGLIMYFRYFYKQKKDFSNIA